MTTVTLESASWVPGYTSTTGYTVPAGKTATLLSAVAAGSSSTGTANVTLRYQRSGTEYTLSNAISVTSSASVNLLPGKVVLQAGDVLRGLSSVVGVFESVPVTGITGVSFGSFAFSGNTIIGFSTSSGIFRSTDGGATWTNVYSSALSAANSAAYIGTTYFVYTSSTTALRSTDGGATWGSVAVTNAPAAGANNLFGAIVKTSGSVWGGLTSSTQLATTTDGITWTNVGAAFPNAVNTFCYTGTHWVAGRSSGSGDVYRSTDGASWSTVTISTGSVSAVASDGAGRVFAGGPNGSLPYSSQDHGATWTYLDGWSWGTGSRVGWTGQVFVSSNSTAFSSSATLLPGSITNAYSTSSFSAYWALSSSRMIRPSGGTAAQSASLAVPPTYGVTITASAVLNS